MRWPSHAVVLSTSFSGSGTYCVTARVASLTSLGMKEPVTADTPASPLAEVALMRTRLAQDGALDGIVDVDNLRIKPSKTGRLFVQAVTPRQSLSPSTVSVAILGGDCTTPLSPLRPVQQEAAVTAGQTDCAVLSSLTGYVGPYQLIASQEL